MVSEESIVVRTLIEIILIACIVSVTATTSVVAQGTNDTDCPVENEVELNNVCANFDYSPSKPTIEDTISLDATSSFDPNPGAGITGYNWGLANRGGPNDPLILTNGPTPTVSFDSPGIYTVRLEVTTPTQTQIHEKKIEVVNTPPTVSFDYSPKEPLLGENITFDASDSYDIEYGIERIKWDLDDGTKTTGSRFGHIYDEPGVYEVFLSVSDGEIAVNRTETITIENNPPEAKIEVESLPNELTVDDNVVLNASESFDEEYTQNVESNNIDGVGIKQYTWRLGDGTSINGTAVNYSYKKPGDYQVLLEVDDGEDISTEALDLEVINRPSVARFSYTPNTDPSAGQEITFDASGSEDPDKDIEEYIWEFGDGNTAKGKMVKHSYDELGVYEVTLTVRDSMGKDKAQKQISVGPRDEDLNGFGFVSVLMAASLVILARFLYVVPS